MKEINRERFEAWLFSQPGEREFVFLSNNGCAVCEFLKTQTTKLISVGGYTYDLDKENHNLPDWLMEMRLVSIRPSTIANMQRRYLELFPEAKEAIEAPEVQQVKA